MPSIEAIRFVNFNYSGAQDRRKIQDLTLSLRSNHAFCFLANGGGKTTLIHAILSVLRPDAMIGNQHIYHRLRTQGTTHIGIEWRDDTEKDVHYLTLESIYSDGDIHKRAFFAAKYSVRQQPQYNLEQFPLTEVQGDQQHVIRYDTICQKYKAMEKKNNLAASWFFPDGSTTQKDYRQLLETEFHIPQKEVDDMIRINNTEGINGMASLFDSCHSSQKLLEHILLPFVLKNESQMFYTSYQTVSEQVTKLAEAKKMKQDGDKARQLIQAYEKNEKDYYTATQCYEENRNRLDAIAQACDIRENDLQQKQTQWQQQEQDLQKNKNKQEKQLAQIEVQEAKNTANQARERADYAKSILDHERKCYQDVTTFYYNRHYIQSLSKEEDISGQIKQKKQEIQLYQQKNPTDALQQEIQNVQGEIAYTFHKKAQDCQTQKCAMEDKAKSIKSNLQEAQEKQEKISEQRQDKNNKIVRLKTQYEQLNKSIQEKLKASTCSSPKKLPSLLTSIERELATIEANIPKYQKKKTALEQKQDQCQQKLKQLAVQETKQTTIGKQSEKFLNKADAQAKQSMQAILVLPNTKETYQTVDALYRNQDLLLEKFKNLIQEKEKQQKEYEKSYDALRREYAPYQTCDAYIPDPKATEAIQNQLCHIRGATTAISLLMKQFNGEQTMRILKQTAFLATAVVVPATELSQTEERLEKVSNQFTHPVTILTEAQFQEILTKKENPFYTVLPHAWQHIHQATFRQWKQQMERDLQQTLSLQQNLSEQLKELKKAENTIQVFFYKFSPTDYLENQQNKENARKELQQISSQKTDCEKTIQDCLTQLAQLNETLTRQEGLQSRRQDQKNAATEAWEQYQQQCQQEKLIQQYQNEKTDFEEKLSYWNKTVQELQQQHESYQEQAKNFQNEWNHFFKENQELYKKCKDTGLVAHTISFEYLRTRFIQLNEQQKGRQADLTRLQNEQELLEQQLANQKTSTQEIKAFADANDIYLMDTYQPAQYPQYYPCTDEALETEMKQRKKTVEKARNKWNETDKAVIEANTAYNNKRETFQKNYQEAFQEMHVSTGIIIQQKSTLQQGISLVKQKLTNTQEKIEHVNDDQKILRKIKDKVSPYRMQKKQNLEPYFEMNVSALQQLAKDALQTDNDRKKEKKQAENRRVAQRLEIKQECQKIGGTVERMVTQFLHKTETVQTWDEFSDCMQKLNQGYQTLAYTIREMSTAAENSIHSTIVAFISNLKKLQNKVEGIADNTKAEMEPGKKENIYKFQFNSAPTDEEGYDRLKKWLMQVSDNLKDTKQSKQNYTDEKLEFELRNLLSPMQLFNAWYGTNKFFRVSCKKASQNEGQAFLPGYFAWDVLQKKEESSTTFSGAEGWVRNVILLLAGLSYSANARYATKPRKGYLNRFCVMDNPIGGSNSTTMVEPVMKFADQHGYQLICFSGIHDEQVLRYFPVHYSFTAYRGTKQDTIMGTTLTTAEHRYLENTPVLEREQVYQNSIPSS